MARREHGAERAPDGASGERGDAERSDADLRWNFRAGVIDAAGWGVGMGLISHTTILPLFVRHLTSDPVAVGLIQALMLGGWLVPGILVAGWVERQVRVKTSVMWIAALERGILLLLAGLCLWLGTEHRGALLAAFLACWFVMNAAMGANTPGYYKLIAKTIPAERRGRLYALGGVLQGVVGVGAARLAEWFLKTWGFPGGYAACFLAAFVAQSATVIPLGFMREPPQPPEAAPPSPGPLRALRLAWEDRRLGWICVAVGMFSLNMMAGGFYALFAMERFRVTDEVVAQYTAVLMGAKAVAFLVVGALGDRYGNRVALRVASVSGLLAALLALGAPGPAWLYAVFALNELATQGWGVCSMNYVLELCPPERSSTYTAVFGLLSGPCRVALPLLGGVVVKAFGFGPVFTLAVFGAVMASFLLFACVPEPRHGDCPRTSA